MSSWCVLEIILVCCSWEGSPLLHVFCFWIVALSGVPKPWMPWSLTFPDWQMSVTLVLICSVIPFDWADMLLTCSLFYVDRLLFKWSIYSTGLTVSRPRFEQKCDYAKLIYAWKREKLLFYIGSGWFEQPCCLHKHNHHSKTAFLIFIRNWNRFDDLKQLWQKVKLEAYMM